MQRRSNKEDFIAETAQMHYQNVSLNCCLEEKKKEGGEKEENTKMKK